MSTISCQATLDTSNAIDLEGNRLVVVKAGHSDMDSTLLHVSSTDMAVAGDELHQWLIKSNDR